MKITAIRTFRDVPVSPGLRGEGTAHVSWRLTGARYLLKVTLVELRARFTKGNSRALFPIVFSSFSFYILPMLAPSMCALQFAIN